ncbi:MAG: hypothetical protein JNK73_14810 [Bacteroidia bacterium]|nr:hypothetical protein [Bacteroidia bacterium]
MDKEKILKIVINQIEQVIETLPDNQKFKVNEDTALFGPGSNIDSLSLVSIIVDLEMLFSNEHNIEISLTDDRAMARNESPFSSVKSLVDYITELTNEK